MSHQHYVRELGELDAYRPGVVMDIVEPGPGGEPQLVRVAVEIVRVPHPPLPLASLYVGGPAADRVWRHIFVAVAR